MKRGVHCNSMYLVHRNYGKGEWRDLKSLNHFESRHLPWWDIEAQYPTDTVSQKSEVLSYD